MSVRALSFKVWTRRGQMKLSNRKQSAFRKCGLKLLYSLIWTGHVLSLFPETWQPNRSTGEGWRASWSRDAKTGSAGGAGGPRLCQRRVPPQWWKETRPFSTCSHLQTCCVWSLQAVQSARALQWIIDTLKSQDFAAKDAPTLSNPILFVRLHLYTPGVSDKHSVSFFPAAFAADEASGQAINTTRIEEQHHVNARQLSYPGGQVSRFPVPEEKVPWEVFCQHQWWWDVLKKLVWVLVFITRAPSFRSDLTCTNQLACPVMTGTAWTGLFFQPSSFPSILSFNLEHIKVR